MCLCAVLGLLYGNSPEITRGASVQLLGAMWCLLIHVPRQGDVCIAQEAVTTLPSVLSCSSPAASRSGGAGAASSLPQLLLRAQPNYQFEIAQSTEHSFKKCNNLHFTEKD